MDDTTWVVEGDSVSEVVHRLERCAAASLRWADDNAVRFETSKIEAVLFSRKRKHWQQSGEKRVHVEDQAVCFARESTRWLGTWLDSTLILRENRRRYLSTEHDRQRPGSDVW